MAIHPLAAVDPAAEVHEEAVVGPFCYVGANVRLAEGVELRNHATVYGRTTIGAGTVLFPGAVVGGDPQDRKFRGEDSEVVVGRNCRIHECATINKGTAGGGMRTVVGDDCLIMAYSHIAHDCHLGDQVVLGNNAQLAGHVRIGRKAVISGMAGVHHFVTIGDLSFVGAMSGVRCDVPPYIMVEGRPAEPRQVNIVGLRRDDWSDEDIRAVKDAFRSLFHDRNGRPLRDALIDVRGGPLSGHLPVLHLCSWLDDQLEHSVKGRLQEAFRVN